LRFRKAPDCEGSLIEKTLVFAHMDIERSTNVNRRTALRSFAALAVAPRQAFSKVPQPYHVSLVSGGNVDGLWQAGVLVELEKDWKTYWRNPGDAGIPPQFDWAASRNVGSVDVSYPVPARFRDASGEAIGYHDRVLFPVSVKASDSEKPVQLKLKMFFAVCQTVCIPASAELESELNISNSNMLISEALQRVPVKNAEPSIATNPRFDILDSKPALVIAVSQSLVDIFVETDSQAYFGQPRFDVKPDEAWLPLANVKDVNSLKNKPLKLTMSLGDKAIEQTITVN
jgi:DsbC/DsbD-like thiol-disulfide interchange protein